MEAKFLPDAESANVIAELKGSEKPDEIVVIGGHFDSWDVGQGAHDDGGGCIVAWEAVRLLKELGLRPRRTIRVVLYTNEENGLRGGNAYRDAHRAEIAKHFSLSSPIRESIVRKASDSRRQRHCKCDRTFRRSRNCCRASARIRLPRMAAAQTSDQSCAKEWLARVWTLTAHTISTFTTRLPTRSTKLIRESSRSASRRWP